MGHKVPVDALRARAEEFFKDVVDTLVERNNVRGDSYLEMDVDDFVAMMRDKAGRIKTGAGQNLDDPKVIFELIDSTRDIAGYAALFSIWMRETWGRKEAASANRN